MLGILGYIGETGGYWRMLGDAGRGFVSPAFLQMLSIFFPLFESKTYISTRSRSRPKIAKNKDSVCLIQTAINEHYRCKVFFPPL